MRSIKTRIILLSSVLLTLSIGICLCAALLFLKLAHAQNIFQIFDQTDSVVQTLFEVTRRQMKNEAILIAEIPMLSQAVKPQDQKKFKDTVEIYRKQLQIDFVDVFSKNGTLLTHVSGEESTPVQGLSPPYTALIQDALHGLNLATFLAIGNRLTIIGAAPLGASEAPSGVLVVGSFLDDKFATQLKRLTGADLSIRFPDKKIISSSLSSPDREKLAAILENYTAPADQARRIEDHVLRVSPLKDSHGNLIGELASYLSLEDMERTSNNILKTVSLFGLVIILVSLGLSTLMGQALTRNLIAVIAATKRIASGDFQFKLPEEGRDEVGDLARSINHMSDKIIDLLAYEKAKVEYEKELETANAVQMTFFSAPSSRVAPFAVSAFYSPARQIGGDWWGHHTLGNGVELILIGDATGHGVPAALVTAMAYSTSNIYAHLLSQTPETVHHPSRILQELNRLLYACLAGKLCMSFFAAIFDAQRETLTFANGGHCFPFLIPKEANDDLVNQTYSHPIPCVALNYQKKSSASLLGMDPHAQFLDDEVKIKKGDRVVFYTDGLIEARSPEGKMWGTRHFLKSLAHHYPKDLTGMCDAVIQDLKLFYQQKNFEDDVTIVGIEYF